MHFSLTLRQLVFLFYIITLLLSCVLGAVHSSDGKPQTCCVHTSSGHVSSGRIANCAYTEKKGRCLEAYVFLFKNGKLHCSSVNAKGIKTTLAMLEKIIDYRREAFRALKPSYRRPTKVGLVCCEAVSTAFIPKHIKLTAYKRQNALKPCVEAVM
ncbi:hypothetical protein Baya_6270 [Bagarius yarrelli]|uniref:Chemokine interleukin-8-like domain-containing protein n=1 Tax=Bagarius yarrelli TaxID=175774 RepID=A0A556TXH7_BAGYA|nr:hypothetical protein Baya_6270 [Bagarius yarrelli]